MWLLILILMTGSCYADVYVLTAPDKSVQGVSEQDDMVVPSGYKKDIIKNKRISDLTVTMGEERLYDFNGNKFTLNSKRLQDKNKMESDNILIEEKENAARKTAIDKIKTVAGLTDDEIKAILK